MSEAMVLARAEGVTQVIFVDLFLPDVRAYQEDRLDGTGISPIFPSGTGRRTFSRGK